MKGYQVTFFTEQNHRYGHQVLHEWLLYLARSMGIQGATCVIGAEGFGRSGKMHLAHFFSLAEQPVEVTMAMSEEQTQALFERLNQEAVDIFYVKSTVEYGTVGTAPGPGPSRRPAGRIEKP
jgi:PII-like signaling protein